MTKKYSIVGRGGAFFAGEATYGGGADGELQYIRLNECIIPSAMAFEESAAMKQGDYRNPGTWLSDAKEFNATADFHAHMSTWPAAKIDTASISPLWQLIGGLLGNPVSGGMGTLKATGSTAKVLQFPDSGPYAVVPSELGFKPGEGLAVRNPGESCILGFADIEEVDDAAYTVVLRAPLKAEPTGEATVYGGFTIPKLEWDEDVLLSAEFQTLGGAEFDVRKAIGVTTKQIVIDCPFGQKPTITLSLHGHPQPLVLSETGGNPGIQSYPYPEATQVLHGGLYAYYDDTLVALEGGFKITIDCEHSPIRGIHCADPNGYQAPVCAGRPIQVELAPAHKGNEWHQLQYSPSVIHLRGWFGFGPMVIAWAMPAATLIAPVGDGTEGQTKTNTLTFGDGAYTGDVGTFDPEEDAGNASFMLWTLAGETA
jgi:hypothetical protein